MESIKILALSNGHGEDAIALRILQQLQPTPVELAALPLVGTGQTYRNHDIPIISDVQAMPSGGFIYMDGRQVLRDLRGGLAQLTLTQLGAIKAWAKSGGKILAVGDIVPLLFAWWSGADYAFVGTAKSEYYLRDQAGRPLPNLSVGDRFAVQSGSVYLPWERWLMQRVRCRAVFPRDALTTVKLQDCRVGAWDLGNPMVDGFGGDGGWGDGEESGRISVLLLPGSRLPEAFENWGVILEAIESLIEMFERKPLLFECAIAPNLAVKPFVERLELQGWQWVAQGASDLDYGPSDRDGDRDGDQAIDQNIDQVIEQTLDRDLHFFKGQARLKLLSARSITAIQSWHRAGLAIAMAGTATEQFVGLGKPVITLPGGGPQFTPAFAEAQSRLLGISVILVDHPQQVAVAVQEVLADPERLQAIAANGKHRMGLPGAAERIAERLWLEFRANSTRLFQV
jgi:uncharacterized protein (TIGR03492 family)